MTLGLPAPLFTIDLEGKGDQPLRLPRDGLKRFLDSLEPAFALQVSLGQVNTMILCPALTTHSELSTAALDQAGIRPSTMRISVGDEDPHYLLEHLERAAELAFGDQHPQIARGFPDRATVSKLYEQTYIDVHSRWVRSRVSSQN
jgi:hypothetical protein